MSIPKEPRQLMINIMYLVLTAMLALNVSAEIINAFFAIDKGLRDSNKFAENSVHDSAEALKESLKNAERSRKFGALGPGVEEIRGIVKDFNGYIDEVRSNLIDATGDKNGKEDDGDYIEEKGHKYPKGKKDKDATTRILVNEKKGDEIEKKILETRDKMLESYVSTLKKVQPNTTMTAKDVAEKLEKAKTNATLTVTEEWKESDKTSWADYKFRQMPLAAVLPSLSKMQTDAKTMEVFMVNDLAGLVTITKEITFNKFFPVINAKKGYVIKGEQFEAEVALGAYSSDVKDISIQVEGRNIPLKDGVGSYSETASSTGKRTINLTAIVKNPLTGEVSNIKKTFDYEVGVRSATVSADKMNVFYIGVDNPISVAVAGASSNEIKVNGTNCSVSGSGGKYTVRVNSPGDAVINVSGGGLPSTPFNFRIKRIPDPVPCLKPNGPSSGALGNGEFKAYMGVLADLRNFDFEAKCSMMGFTLTKQSPRQDPLPSVNSGARYNEKSANLVNTAKPGDVYYFDDIKVQCPGDGAGRALPPMVWKIK